MKLHLLSHLFTAAALVACGGPSDETNEIEYSYGALDATDEAPTTEDRTDMTERPDLAIDICRGGGILARVAPPGDDGVGLFEGVFTNRAGERLGRVRGKFGHRENGTQAIFGKMVARTGAFEARFRGLWERGDEGLFFRARLHKRDGEAIGAVRGKIEDVEGRGGAMHARWGLACDTTMDGSDLPPSTDGEEQTRPTGP
jgi:hypothetical protein